MSQNEKWYQLKLFIVPTLIGSCLTAGFLVVIANRPNSPIISRIEPVKPVPFGSAAVNEPLNNSDAESFEQPSTSSSFNFPQASCGDKPTGADDTWYPVFVDGGDLETIRSRFCADAVSTVREDSQVKSVQLASFTSYDKAVEFAQAVGGEVGKPTSPDSADSEPGSEPPEPSSSVVNNPTAPLTLNALRWYTNSSGFVQFEGQVTNTSDQPIRSLAALAEFYDANGQFITSETAYMQINPLMPGQSSPFGNMARHNPQMNTIKIRFKTFDGEISYNDARVNTQEP